ncbi:MAG TPA: hypothetical protein VFC19_02925 [Candidatus Limnocylindrales bacterium]|nr:hypothetical protein [Candidatus Limnocylindrales bacterium]
MTETLKSFLSEQAASVAFKAPDLEAIARDNHRRVWRRRAATVVAAVLALAVLAGTAAVWTNLAGRQPDTVTNPVPSGAALWAGGTTIHNGADTIEVGHKVRAFVPTTVGFVTIDDVHNVYSVTSGRVTQIGQAMAVPSDGTGYMRLFSDPQGSLAGWVGSDESGVVLHVHDQATGKTSMYKVGGGKLLAIDDRRVYWSIATRGIFAVDFDTGVERQLASAAESVGVHIWSVQNGLLALSKNYQERGNASSLIVGRSIAEAREFTFSDNAEASGLRLSPTGAWLAYLLVEFDGPPVQDKVLAFHAHVRDTATGEVIPLKFPRAGLVIPVGWLSDTSLQVFALAVSQDQSSARANMYTCRLPDGSCTVAAALPLAAVEGSNLVLPTGEWIGQ